MNKIPDEGLRAIILTAYEENYDLYLRTEDKKYLDICNDMEQAFYKCGGTREFLKETVDRINQNRLNKCAKKLNKCN
jgi:hypothetical protein